MKEIGLFIFARMIAVLGQLQWEHINIVFFYGDLYYYFGVGMSSAWAAAFTGRKLGEKGKDLAILYMRAAQYSGLLDSIL